MDKRVVYTEIEGVGRQHSLMGTATEDSILCPDSAIGLQSGLRQIALCFSSMGPSYKMVAVILFSVVPNLL